MASYRRSFLLLIFPLLLISCAGDRKSGVDSDALVRTSVDGSASDEAPAPAATDGSARTETAEANGEVVTGSSIPSRAGQLTAGEWNDLREWTFWKNLRQRSDVTHDVSSALSHWGFSTNGRVAVNVTSGSAPIVDARVELLGPGGQVVWSARTDNRGNAELFATESAPQQSRGEKYTVRVQAGGQTATLESIAPGNETRHAITVPGASGATNGVDVMFVVDATGSMGDEIEFLKTELRDVMARSAKQVGEQQTYRLASTFYRDFGDEYVVRSFPFTTSVDQVLEQMGAQEADGGGDFEEAVEEGLADALEKQNWSTRARARLLFLVLDAPPHPTTQIGERIEELTKLAASKGVRIIPVASSGIDKPTEFFLRNLAIATGGTYVFLTNHSGIGNSHIEPTIGEYKVEYLNDLLVRLIVEYSGSVAGGATATLR